MKKTLFALTAALLMTVPACCFGPHRGGPGGPGGCGCKCRQMQDCPQKNCPPGSPDCQKGQQPCPQHQPPAK
jgi:hypothetical protein